MRNEYVTDTIILSGAGKSYTLLMKGRISAEIADFTARFELRIDYPVVFNGGTCQFGVIGTTDELQNIVNAAKEREWGMEILAVHDYNPLVSGLLDEFTEKQREILKAAYRYGYFDHPRKIDGESWPIRWGSTRQRCSSTCIRRKSGSSGESSTRNTDNHPGKMALRWRINFKVRV